MMKYLSYMERLAAENARLRVCCYTLLLLLTAMSVKYWNLWDTP